MAFQGPFGCQSLVYTISYIYTTFQLHLCSEYLVILGYIPILAGFHSFHPYLYTILVYLGASSNKDGIYISTFTLYCLLYIYGNFNAIGECAYSLFVSTCDIFKCYTTSLCNNCQFSYFLLNTHFYHFI